MPGLLGIGDQGEWPQEDEEYVEPEPGAVVCWRHCFDINVLERKYVLLSWEPSRAEEDFAWYDGNEWRHDEPEPLEATAAELCVIYAGVRL